MRPPLPKRTPPRRLCSNEATTSANIARRRWPVRLALLSAALLMLAASLLGLNQIDEPLAPATQAWLSYAVPTVDDDSNGYLTLLGLNAQVSNPRQAARQLLQEEQVAFDTPAPPSASTPDYAGLRERRLQPAAIQLGLPACRMRCLESWRAQADMLAALAARHADGLSRYRHMLDATDYLERDPRDPRRPSTDFSAADQFARLHLAQIVAALEQGNDVQAYAEWARQQAFWQRAAAGSLTLQDLEQVMHQLERSEALLSALLDVYPNTRPVAAHHALPVLETRPELSRLLARSSVIEFQRQAFALTTLIGTSTLLGSEDRAPDWRDRLALLFYQPQASLNLLRHLHQEDLWRNGVFWPPGLTQESSAPRSGSTCPRWSESAIARSWQAWRNPVGKMLLCREGAYEWDRTHQRAAALDAAASELQRQLLE